MLTFILNIFARRFPSVSANINTPHSTCLPIPNYCVAASCFQNRGCRSPNECPRECCVPPASRGGRNTPVSQRPRDNGRPTSGEGYKERRQIWEGRLAFTDLGRQIRWNTLIQYGFNISLFFIISITPFSRIQPLSPRSASALHAYMPTSVKHFCSVQVPKAASAVASPSMEDLKQRMMKVRESHTQRDIYTYVYIHISIKIIEIRLM